MTVIVAAKNSDGVVTLAADRQTTAGTTRVENSEPKLWVSGKYVLGCAGAVRAAQVIRYTADWPVYRPKENPNWVAFVVTEIVPAMHQALRRQELPIDDTDVVLVIATRGRFAAIYPDGSVLADRSGRTAVGSGATEALGYLGIEGPWSAGDVVSAAARAALTDLGVSGPISVADTHSLEVVTE